MVTEHVHDAHLGNADTEQVGALRHTGTHQQSAVTAAHDGHLLT